MIQGVHKNSEVFLHKSKHQKLVRDVFQFVSNELSFGIGIGEGGLERPLDFRTQQKFPIVCYLICRYIFHNLQV